jgi:hypothetical protein
MFFILNLTHLNFIVIFDNQFKRCPRLAARCVILCGNSAQNHPKADLEGIDGHVTIWDAH